MRTTATEMPALRSGTYCRSGERGRRMAVLNRPTAWSSILRSISALDYTTSGGKELLLRESGESALPNVRCDLQDVGVLGCEAFDFKPNDGRFDIAHFDIQLQIRGRLVGSLDRDTTGVLDRGVDRDRQTDAHGLLAVATGMIDDDVPRHHQIRHEDLPPLVGDEGRVRER